MTGVITSVQARVLAADGRDPLGSPGRTFMAVLVSVTTDDGVTGYGESIARADGAPVKALVDTLLGPLVLERSIHEVASIHDAMFKQIGASGQEKGVGVEAISGVDTAIWDALGRSAGEPIFALLRGAARSSVPVYASSVFIKPAAEMCDEACRLAGAGHSLIKVKVGRALQARSLAEDIAALEAVRAAVPAHVQLCIDANSAYTTSQALDLARALAPLDLAFFEEPIAPDDLEGYRTLRDQCGITLAAGENAFSVHTFRELIGERLIGVVQPDLGRCGGITGAMQVATLAYAFDVAFAPHTGFSGGLSQLAALQVSAAVPNLSALEHMCIDNPLRDLFVGTYPEPANGLLAVPTGPGLGMEIDLARVDRFAVS
ncbi:MAG: mandelate racemase/muconate lactonizing enzyme family protein [Candidatus Dormibacter sp.]